MPRPTYDRKSLQLALAAYSLWGLFPLYWKLLKPLAALEIFSHRIIWSFCFYGLLFFSKDIKKIWLRFRFTKQQFILLSAAAILVSINWLTYIYAINAGHVLQGSLAYFITPLLNIAIGRIIFQEYLSIQLKMAILLATIGVFLLTYAAGEFPWLALIMAITFSFYGMIKKIVKIDASLGSFLETGIVLIPAILIASYQRSQVSEPFTYLQIFLLLGSGVVTGLPLVWFAEAAQKLPYSLMGVFQFISPTLQFILAIYLYNEPFSHLQSIAFCFIWIGIFFYLREFLRKK